MKNIVIIGAGGFGREVQWLLERMNEKEKQWNLLGYIDDGVAVGTIVDGASLCGHPVGQSRCVLDGSGVGQCGMHL